MTDLAQVDATPSRDTMGNTRVGVGITGVLPLQDIMAAYDALPAVLRSALAAAPVPWSPVKVLQVLRDWGATYGRPAAIQALARTVPLNDQRELQAFALAYHAETGRTLPHLAAQASTQRPQWEVVRRRRVPGEPRRPSSPGP